MWTKLRRLLHRSKEGPSGTILVVEDGEVDQKLITSTLKRRGYTVLLAQNGESGIVQAFENQPDLIILDFGLPDMDGRSVCERLKAKEETKNIPVIFLTAKDTPLDIIESYEVGAEYFLSKPISAGMLLTQVEATLKQQAQS